MNVTIGLCALLVGELVLPTQESSIVPPIRGPSVWGQLGQSRPSPEGTRGSLRTPQGGPYGYQTPFETRIPLIPTDPSADAASPFGLIPEGSSDLLIPQGGARLGGSSPYAGGGGFSGLRQSSRYVSPSPLQSASSYAALEALGPRNATVRDPLRPAATTGGLIAAEKPYADYRLPPVVSPYLRMFTGSRSVTTNYDTLVRPLVEQTNFNTRVGGQVRGLRGTSYRQGTAIRTLGRETQRLQNQPSSSFYRNYGGYNRSRR